MINNASDIPAVRHGMCNMVKLDMHATNIITDDEPGKSHIEAALD